MQQVTAARDLKDHRRLARRAVQSNCPTGYTSSKVEDPFTSTKQDFWQVKKHADGLKYTGDGLEMHTNEANVSLWQFHA